MPPVAARRPVVHELHGVRRTDDYAWMREVDAPETQTYLAEERAFYDACTSHLHPWVRMLTQEMSSRVPPTDRGVSWRFSSCVYYPRTPAGEDFPQVVRRPVDGDETTEQVVLDTSSLRGDSTHVDLGLQMVSPDERVLAYSVDTVGDEVFELRFRDLDTGRDLPESVARTYYGGAWSADSRSFFYTVHDAAYRPYQLWRHDLSTAVADDELVLAEPDERFELMVRRSRSGAVVIAWMESRDTSEVWLLDAHDPTAPPRCVEPRWPGLSYHVEHARIGGEDVALVVTDDLCAEFRLVRAPLATPGREHWTEMVPARTGHRLERVDAFAEHLVLSQRGNGSPWLRVLPLAAGQPYDLRSTPAAGTIRLARNEVFDTGAVTVVEQSYTCPPVWSDVQLATGVRSQRHRRQVPGYSEDDYLSERREVLARDGVLVPVTVVRRRDVALDGRPPALLYAYGAHESCFEPNFDVSLLSLLDRRVVFVHAHVRGGGENGRRWWLDGRLAAKQHTFSDLIDVADHLADGLVDGTRIATRGSSAGGLLQAAVFSQRPDRWRAVVAEVPFVDVVTTMLDQTVPLTVNEWDEWGDPRRPEDFAWMLAYSPFDNPPAGPRPDLLVTGAVHDARVMVWEPAKWVARLRATDPHWSPHAQFRCELGEWAHFGPTGRYAALAYEAEIYAWVLERLDALEP
ncbi:S9 family peptidase [soil metagenome]